VVRSRFLLAASLVALVACGQAPERPGAAQGEDPIPAPKLTLQPTGGSQACVGVDAPTERLPVDVFAVIDGSSSMADATATGVSKWYATKAAFQDFLAAAPADMGIGLSLFPLESGMTCETARYQEAALPIGQARDMIGGVLERLEAVTPWGQTPTAPALTAALDLAGKHAEQHPERSVVVVLASDGMPTACDPLDAAALAQLAKQALQGPGHVRTLVVALSSLAGADLSGFSTIAAAGGTDRPLLVDPQGDFSAELSEALGAAATERVACDLAVPAPPEGQALDYDSVNVVLDGEEARVTFPRVAGPADCSVAGGWYYDIDPEVGAPTRINVCKATCDRLTSRSNAALSVELGCKTQVK
jgi:hypothetical protein